MKREDSLPYESFIGGYYIDPKVCDMMIDYFNQNKERASAGQTNINGVTQIEKKVKESVDYYFHPYDLHTPIYEYKVELQKCLDAYIDDYDRVDHLGQFGVVVPANIQ